MATRVIGTVAGVMCCGAEIKHEDLRVADQPPKASREYRYEAFCPYCKKCDPNGYSSLKKLLAETPNFWNKKDTRP